MNMKARPHLHTQTHFAYLEESDLQPYQIRRKRFVEDLLEILDWGVSLKGILPKGHNSILATAYYLSL